MLTNMLYELVSAGDALKNVVRKRAKQERTPICFLHLPKCGGTSLDLAIRKQYPFSNIRLDEKASVEAAKGLYNLNDPLVNDFYDVMTVRQQVVAYYMGLGVRFISGHFCFDDAVYRHFQGIYSYITLLRDPVQRWISHYFYNRYKRHSDYHKLKGNVKDYLQSEEGRNLGHLYVKMLGGLNKTGDYNSQQAIERAQANLHKFAIVGCLEYMGDALTEFEQQLGLKLNIPRQNVNPKSQPEIQALVTQEIREEIIRICQPDVTVYEYAVKTFVQKHVAH